MKRLKILYLLVFFVDVGYCQTGTVGDPFTTLNQALQANSAGVYFFNIGGTTFDTYTDANGYVLVAIDFGNGVGNLPQGTGLDLGARGILNTTVLASITTHTEIRISTSSGNIDATTTNATLLARITSNSTLHTGSADNGINNGWTGTGATNFTNSATGTSPTANSLHRKIFHPSGNTNTFHWQPRLNQQRESHASGEIAAGASLMLWVRDNSILLPVELLNFNVNVENDRTVNLDWQTATETNNDYFMVERSANALEWEQITIIEGAGSSSTLLNYSAIDGNPYSSVSYYRLKQTDFDGQFEYSNVKSVNLNTLGYSKVQLFPNPTSDQVIISGNEIELTEIEIFNTLGQDVSAITPILHNDKTVTVDMSNLSSGMYHIKTKTTANKVYKQ